MPFLAQLFLTFAALCALILYVAGKDVDQSANKEHGRAAVAAEADACAARGGNVNACKRAAAATCIEHTPYTRISLTDCYELAGLPHHARDRQATRQHENKRER